MKMSETAAALTSFWNQAPDASWMNGSRTISEPVLIQRALRGDLNAFNELVLAYQDRVFRQALWLLGDEEAAQDAAQETFLSVYRKLSTFRGGPFRPWILRITTNYCLDQLRAASRRKTCPLEPACPDSDDREEAWIRDPGESPEQAVERTQARQEIARSIRRLSPEYRAAILMVDLQELDYSEAARALSIPIGTLKSRVVRARRKLGEELRKYIQDVSPSPAARGGYMRL